VPVFRDVAREAGVRFRQGWGGKRPLTILEATGSGCALLDFDGDGGLDLFLAGRPRCALYRNNRDGTFADVTRAAGLDREGYWIGCGAGDTDNDGDSDLFVTGYKTCAFYRNEGGLRFSDVTGAAGLRDRSYQTSAAFADVNRDGFLDLYLCRYVRFGPDEPQYCREPGTDLRRTCGPDVYLPEVGSFYRNRGDGSFVEATRQFGFDTAHGKAWGAAFGDFDRDGWPDLYVANDEMPGDLFRNTGGGRMENIGLASGAAYGADGSLQGGMGVDFGDYDNDGWPDLVVTTFWMEPTALYRNQGPPRTRGAGSARPWLFSEVSQATGIAQDSLRRVGFGTRFLDADNDGWLDLYFLNGHVQDIGAIDPEQGMPERMQLFLNVPTARDEATGAPSRRFHDASAQAGEVFQRGVVGRGAAVGDFDNDGRLDIAAMDLEGDALLLRNAGTREPARHWLIVRALTAPDGRRFRDAIGAQVTVQTGKNLQMREVQTGGSVLCANDPRVHFGLGAARLIDRLSIRWPDGATETHRGVAADQILTLRQTRRKATP
jgi:hypothetical protein